MCDNFGTYSCLHLYYCKMSKNINNHAVPILNRLFAWKKTRPASDVLRRWMPNLQDKCTAVWLKTQKKKKNPSLSLQSKDFIQCEYIDDGTICD